MNDIPMARIDARLERLRRSPDSAIQKMADSLRRQGQLTPVILTSGDPDPFLIDGFKRYRAAPQVGLSHLKAQILDISVPKAKSMIYLLNRRGAFPMIAEALLIRELVETDGLNQSEVAILLERHKSWVSRRLAMIKALAPEVIDDLLLELIPPGSGPILARLPVCNQVDFAAVILRDRLTSSEIRPLVDIFLKNADPGFRQFLLKAPREVLNVVQRKGRSQSALSMLLALRRLSAHLTGALAGQMTPQIQTGLEEINAGQERIYQILTESPK